MDFSGTGFITEESFLNSIACQKCGFTREELCEFLKLTGLFSSNPQGMNFDTFKKTFFPHLYLINDDAEESDEEKRQQ
jgi:hypothetical protein